MFFSFVVKLKDIKITHLLYSEMYSWRNSVNPWSFSGAGERPLASGAWTAARTAVLVMLLLTDAATDGDEGEERPRTRRTLLLFFPVLPIAPGRAEEAPRDTADVATRRRKAGWCGKLGQEEEEIVVMSGRVVLPVDSIRKAKAKERAHAQLIGLRILFPFFNLDTRTR